MGVLFWAAVAAGQTRPAPQAPAPPGIKLGEAAALVKLARSAMQQYLTHRTPADSHPIPDDVRPLARHRYTLALALRDNGRLVARSIQDQGGLVRNVVAAALLAMRSPELPDRVTAEVLDALTVEIEILSPPVRIGEGELAGLLEPGLTGLKLSRGIDDSYLLPATAYLLGLDAEQIPRIGLARLRQGADNLSLPLRRSVFTTSHFVEPPSGRTVWLYRGKILFPYDAIDEKMLRATPERIGEFLVRHQDESGRYLIPQGAASLRDHLYATYAMIRLVRRTGRKDFSRSVTSAVENAFASVRKEGERIYIPADRPADELTATAWLLLINSQMPPSDKARGLREGLLAAVRRELDDRLLKDLAVGARRELSATWLTGAYVATMAMAAVTPAQGGDAEMLARFRTALGKLDPPDVEAEMWALRAGVSTKHRKTGATTRPRPAMVADSRPRDERGGFGLPGRTPTTVCTALRAILVAAELAREQKTGQPAKASEMPAHLLAARRFCFRMMYHSPSEAYFAAAPGQYVGGVRSSPATCRITLPACAAAIEALLAK